MEKVVCIFAHPDDEAFGPSGTIAKLAGKNEVYLICVTRGEHGENIDGQDLARIRQGEARKSAQILGVKKVYFLRFEDGTLSNNLYHQIAAKIKKITDRIKPEIILTNELHGVSGHIDHIAVAMISSYLFEKLSYVKKIMYHCLSEERRAMIKDYFIFFPPGYKKSEIDEIIDVSSVWDKKIAAIKCHASQSGDVERILKYHEIAAKEEYFRVSIK